MARQVSPITFVSVLVALLIGGIEALGLLGDRVALKSRFREAIGALNDNFDALGFVIIGLFSVTWVGSIIAYRYQALDDLNVTPARR